jgi:hypothetical protein
MGHRAILASRACLALRITPNPPGLPRSHKTIWQHAAGSGPRRCQRHLAMNDAIDAAFPIERQGRPPHNTIDFGVNPFHLRCGLLPPCLRFEAVVPVHLRMGGPRAPQNSVPGCWLDITGARIAARLVLCASRRTSLRSGRAGFLHPAPRRTGSLRDTVNDHRRWKRIALEQSSKALPWHAATSTPP